MLKKYTKSVNVIYLIVTVLVLILALLFMTGYQSLSITEDTDLGSLSTEVANKIITARDALQFANNMVLYLFVVGILSFVVLQIFGNGYRKKLYKSNLVVGIAFPALTAVFGIITGIVIINGLNKFNLCYDELVEFLNRFNSTVSDSTALILSIAYVFVYVILNVLYIVYTVFKYKSSRKVA